MLKSLPLFLVLTVLCSSSIAAGQPVVGECIRPEMPGLKGDKVDWQRYAVAMGDYNTCLGAKIKEKGDDANASAQDMLDSVQSSLERIGSMGARGK